MWHGQIDLVIKAKGNLDVDAHHTVEDMEYVLVKLSTKLLVERGINRYGHAYVHRRSIVQSVIDFQDDQVLNIKLNIKAIH